MKKLVRFLINSLLFCVFVFVFFALVMFGLGFIKTGDIEGALGDSTLGQVSLLLSILLSIPFIRGINNSKLWSQIFD